MYLNNHTKLQQNGQERTSGLDISCLKVCCNKICKYEVKINRTKVEPPQKKGADQQNRGMANQGADWRQN